MNEQMGHGEYEDGYEYDYEYEYEDEFDGYEGEFEYEDGYEGEFGDTRAHIGTRRKNLIAGVGCAVVVAAASITAVGLLGTDAPEFCDVLAEVPAADIGEGDEATDEIRSLAQTYERLAESGGSAGDAAGTVADHLVELADATDADALASSTAQSRTADVIADASADADLLAANDDLAEAMASCEP